MPNAYVEWIDEPRRFSSSASGWQYCRLAEVLDVGRFTTVVAWARAVAITGTVQVVLQTAMSKDSAESDWKTLTSGTIELDSVEEVAVTSKPSDAQPMWRWLRYKVGYGSAAFDATIILHLLLRETNS
jgi:hypothetical protein